MRRHLLRLICSTIYFIDIHDNYTVVDYLKCRLLSAHCQNNIFINLQGGGTMKPFVYVLLYDYNDLVSMIILTLIECFV